jgi:hypothetical protein
MKLVFRIYQYLLLESSFFYAILLFVLAEISLETLIKSSIIEKVNKWSGNTRVFLEDDLDGRAAILHLSAGWFFV